MKGPKKKTTSTFYGVHQIKGEEPWKAGYSRKQLQKSEYYLLEEGVTTKGSGKILKRFFEKKDPAWEKTQVYIRKGGINTQEVLGDRRELDQKKKSKRKRRRKS